MKILFVIGTYKPAYIYGGPIVVVALLAEALVKQGHSVTVYTTTANGKTELDVKRGEAIDVNGVKIFYYHRFTKDHTHVSPGLWKKMYNTVGDFDVVHLHSWWNFLILGAALICKLKGIKPLLSPHGMFCDYVLNNANKNKKQFIHALFGKKLLKNSFLHVSTPMEWQECQEMLDNKWEGVIIPNLVEFHNKHETRDTHHTSDIFNIGFISRVDPKKGLDILIKALSGVQFNYRLHVAGSGEESYIESLKQLAVECGNADKIEWVGWKDRIQKFDFYNSIDLFALLSHNENFAIVVIESLYMGTPVLLSDNVGLKEYVEQKQLGWITPIDNVEPITALLEDIYKSTDKRTDIMTRAPEIIAEDFDIDFLANQYVEYYKKMI